MHKLKLGGLRDEKGQTTQEESKSNLLNNIRAQGAEEEQCNDLINKHIPAFWLVVVGPREVIESCSLNYSIQKTDQTTRMYLCVR